MADQTTSSIVIDAPAAEVMAVIADFPAYPEWAQGMKQAEVVEEGANGRAEKVHFELEATPIKDSYTLSYDWKGDSSVTWELVEGHAPEGLDQVVINRGTAEDGNLAVEVRSFMLPAGSRLMPSLDSKALCPGEKEEVPWKFVRSSYQMRRSSARRARTVTFSQGTSSTSATAAP